MDENNDGINEPGEHILVRNLVVRNVGRMPTPATQPINVLIKSTRYLKPVSSESVQLPFGIRPGHTAEVPGVLRALIRRPPGAAPVGSIADIDVWVQLVGTFERLDRSISDFCDPRRVKISYPLVLDQPISLGSVAKGDVVTFRWLTERPCGTMFSETKAGQEACFLLADESQGSNQINNIGPGSSLAIEQEFIVSSEAEDFTYVGVELKLRLSDPQTKAMRTVQEHHMQVQVSSHYQKTENPGYLLVVNSDTPNYAIRQTLSYLKHGLLANVDMFNVSIYGSYDVPGSSESVLSKYMGKSIIIFGNNYDHPGVGFKRPWDLVDPWVATVLLKGGTSLHFSNVTDPAALSSLKAWAELVVFPAHRLMANRQTYSAKNDKALATNLRNENVRLAQETIQEKENPKDNNEILYDLPVKQSKLNLFGSLDSTLSRRTETAVNLLDKSLPLRRFVVAPAPIASPRVLVVEGVPRTARFTATTAKFRRMPLNESTESVSVHDAFLLVASLPYTSRVRMFWNAVQHGHEDGKGIQDNALFAGVEGFASPSTEKASSSRPTAFTVHPQVLQALNLFLQFDLCNEIHLITGARSRFSDPVSAKEKLSQMPLTSYFFDPAPQYEDDVQQIQTVEAAQPLILVLGTVHAVSNSLSSWHCLRATFAPMGNHQGQLKSQINNLVFGAIQRTCAPSIADAVKEKLMARSEQVKRGILSQPRWMPRSYQWFGNQELVALTNNANGEGAGAEGWGWIDLVYSPRTGLALTSQTWKEWVDAYEAGVNARTRSVKASRSYIGDMVN
ncbi:uncharacterized protein PG998_004409 [Apiospora kogelbergensis]|uniref:uncharacterized protein n=1 Tax=Apiospora kogelbergensis TaxID=1337665 RepID=UPI003130BA9F